MGVDWPNSDLYNGLNGSYFLTNTTYVPDSSWSNRIVVSDWHYWTGSDANIDAATMANNELGADTVNAKIGLMYVHDYYYGLEGGNNCNTSGTPGTCKNSWLHLLKNDTNAPHGNEWTISRHSSDFAWFVRSEGDVFFSIYNPMTLNHSVRPVFFLRASERIASGNGTISDPYILS